MITEATGPLLVVDCTSSVFSTINSVLVLVRRLNGIIFSIAPHEWRIHSNIDYYELKSRLGSKFNFVSDLMPNDRRLKSGGYPRRLGVGIAEINAIFRNRLVKDNTICTAIVLCTCAHCIVKCHRLFVANHLASSNGLSLCYSLTRSLDTDQFSLFNSNLSLSRSEILNSWSERDETRLSLTRRIENAVSIFGGRPRHVQSRKEWR